VNSEKIPKIVGLLTQFQFMKNEKTAQNDSVQGIMKSEDHGMPWVGTRTGKIILLENNC
jgi:hypothetical protein